MKKIKLQSGLTLLELMLALGLSLLVISGVVGMLGHIGKNARLLTSETKIQESLNFLSNRLGFVFKEALSSPCGDLNAMMAESSNPTVSQLKVAYTMNSGSKAPQSIPNIILPNAPTPPPAFATTIGQEDFPMLMMGIAGNPNEPVNNVGNPFSSMLSNIVPGSEYFIVLELSDRIKLNTGVVNGVSGGAIPMTTTVMPPRLVGQTGIPFIITDCHQADIFVSDAANPIQNNLIPIDAGLFFSGSVGYRDESTIISPIEVFAYYLSQPAGANTPSLQRLRISNPMGGSQPILDGVTGMQFSWGLGTPTNLSVQGRFNTAELLASGMTQGNIRSNLVNVKVTLTVQEGGDSSYVVGSGANRQDYSKTVERTFTIRNQMQRI